jgi:hypothetical protein
MIAYHDTRHHTSHDTIIHPTSESPELLTVRREFMPCMTGHGVRDNSYIILDTAAGEGSYDPNAG